MNNNRTFKCAHCKGDVIISLPYSGESIKKASKWYHTDCFKETLKPKSRINVESLIEKTKPLVEEAYWKHWIYNLLVSHYRCAYVPDYIFVKLQSIYEGTHKGLAIPIPPEDLADMFNQQMDYLDKLAAAKGINGIPRFNYDLKVLMNKYDSYRNWKAQKNAEIQEQIEAAKESKKSIGYRYDYIPTYNNNQNNISDILDDILDDIED